MSRRNMKDAGGFFESASKEELIAYLIKTIQNEVSKGDDEVDHDLVRECSDWLDELTADQAIFTPEELKRNLEKLKAKAVSEKPARVFPKYTRIKIVRISLLVATMLVISLMSLSAVATNRGYGSAWDLISVNIGKLFGLNLGEEIEEKDITIIKSTGNVQYDSIDAFIFDEELSVLYPKLMPNDILIKQIYVIQESNDKYTLCFKFSDVSYVFNVSNYYLTDLSSLDGYNYVVIDDFYCYYVKKQEGVYCGIIQYNGLEYYIQSPDYESLLTMLNNMKG